MATGATKDKVDYLFKVSIFGDKQVGMRYMVDGLSTGFPPSDYVTCIRTDFCTKRYTVDNNKVKLQIWDTYSRSNSYRPFQPRYCLSTKPC